MKQRFLVLQIIHIALLSGPAIFLALVYFLIPPLEGGTADPIISRIALFSALIGPATAVFLSFRLMKGLSGRADSDAAFGLYQTGKLILWAVLEGVALFNVVAYHLLRGWENGLAAAALIAGMIFFRPSEAEYRDRLGPGAPFGSHQS